MSAVPTHTHTQLIKCVRRVWRRVLSRKCLQKWVKSSRPINLLQPGLDRGLVSVHITEASIPGAAWPTGAFMNNWCCSDWMETLLCFYFYMEAITAFIDIYAVERSETTKCVCYSFRGSLFAQTHVQLLWLVSIILVGLYFFKSFAFLSGISFVMAAVE